MNYNIIVFLFFFIQFSLNGQVLMTLDGIEVSLIDGVNVGQKNLERLNTGKSDLEVFYHKYFYSQDLVAYKALYEYPSQVTMTQEEFNSWKAYMQDADLRVNDAIILFNIGDELFAALPYYQSFEYYNQYHVKLAKYNGVRWIAMPAQEFRKYNKVKTLLTRIQPSYLLSLTKQPEISRELTNNNWRTNSGETTLSQILAQRQNQYLNNLQTRSGKNGIYMSNIQWTKKGSKRFDKVFRSEIESYLVDLNISPSDRQKIIHLLILGEQHAGYTLIEELSSEDDIYLNDHIEFLKELFSDYE